MAVAVIRGRPLSNPLDAEGGEVRWYPVPATQPAVSPTGRRHSGELPASQQAVDEDGEVKNAEGDQPKD